MFPRASRAFLEANAAGEQNRVEPFDINLLYNAYLQTRSVHAAGKRFGISGETARKRLRKTGHKLFRSRWTAEDDLAVQSGYKTPDGVDLSKIAKTVGRSKASIACRAEELGLTENRGRQSTPRRVKAEKERERKRVFEALPEKEKHQIRSERTRAAIKAHGHPRGMLGKHHSVETRTAIGDLTRGKSVPSERVLRSMKTRRLRYGSLCPNSRRGSWQSAWCEVGGKRFYARSLWEANYARYLEFLKTHGEIIDWQHEAQTFWFEKIMRGVRSYLPDFKVTLQSGIEWHEVKGWMDSRSRTTLRRMAKYYPAEVVIVRDKVWFSNNRTKLSGIVPGWTIRRNTSTSSSTRNK